MRILIHSNAPWVTTGYGCQTKQLAPRLQKMGHDVAISAFYGLQGSMLGFPGPIKEIPVYPVAYHLYGMDVIGAHMRHFKADILISLMDAWVIEPQVIPQNTWVPWFPIDMEPLPEIIKQVVRSSLQPIVYSKFGLEMAHNADLDVRYVPHGIEMGKFSPVPQEAAREATQLPKDKFIVGMVAANKGNPSRKSFTQQIEAFAKFHKKHPDTLLYLHTHMCRNGEAGGVNLPAFCEYMGLTIGKDVLFADQYLNVLGFPDSHMANLYSSFDALMSVSMGEGFGVPILEAQACGCPVIVGDWTSMPELCFSGYKIAKADAEPFWSPLHSVQYVAHVDAIAEALETAYAGNREAHIAPARAGAMAYDADLVMTEYWRPVLDELTELLEELAKKAEESTSNVEAVPC